QIAQTPQVRSVGLGIYGNVPPRTGFGPSLIEIPGRTIARKQFPNVETISAGYLSALRIPLSLGRVWSRAEALEGVPLAVINQTMARMFWSNESPIGARIHIPGLNKRTNQFVLGRSGADGWVEVVGVVGDVPNRGLHEITAPAVYVPYTLTLGD